MPERGQQKLLVTVAAKVDEDLARRLRDVAQRGGMKDGQLIRLILERVDAIIAAHYKHHINVSFFLDHLFCDEKQLSLFFDPNSGFERRTRR